MISVHLIETMLHSQYQFLVTELIIFSSTSQFYISRLNSGNKNRHNFFIQGNFKYLNIGSDSVDHDESGDTKVYFQFRGNSILKISLRF